MAKREFWNSRKGFVFASIGAAIGLGNLWRFPFQAYKNGGDGWHCYDAYFPNREQGLTYVRILLYFLPKFRAFNKVYILLYLCLHKIITIN